MRDVVLRHNFPIGGLYRTFPTMAGVAVVGLKSEGIRIINLENALHQTTNKSASTVNTNNSKNSGISLNGLCVSNGWLMGIDQVKPHVKCFNGKNKDVVEVTSTSPEKLGALCTTHTGDYIIGGGAVSGNCYLWNAFSGVLQSVWKAHYRGITDVKIVDDDSILWTCAEDGIIHAWKLLDIVEVQGSAAMPRPFASLKGHTLSVTGLCVGYFGNDARIVSSSLDHSVKIWNMHQLVHTHVLPSEVTCVAMDPMEIWLFAGTQDGVIHQLPLRQDTTEAKRLFEGHLATVTTLEVTWDGLYLLSGSLDQTCRMWDVASGQVLSTFTYNHAVMDIILCNKSAIAGGVECKPLLRYQGQCDRVIELHNGKIYSMRKRKTVAPNLLRDRNGMVSGGEMDMPRKKQPSQTFRKLLAGSKHQETE